MSCRKKSKTWISEKPWKILELLKTEPVPINHQISQFGAACSPQRLCYKNYKDSKQTFPWFALKINYSNFMNILGQKAPHWRPSSHKSDQNRVWRWYPYHRTRDYNDERLSTPKRNSLLRILSQERQVVDLHGVLRWRQSPRHLSR